MYSIGLDIGSSSVKASVVSLNDFGVVSSVKYPEQEMKIDSPQAGWAEQSPDMWWEYVCKAVQSAVDHANIRPSEIKSVGISYQMHGLVIVDRQGVVIRPSIIWCDSRAVDFGKMIESQLDDTVVKNHLFNKPGNFTASKLFWVKENEPQNFSRIHKVMLPGDYIAFKMSGDYTTSFTGLSEGIFYDFQSNEISKNVLDVLGLDTNYFPKAVGSFEVASMTNQKFEELTGILAGTPISYRAGDQPNNALALGVLQSGEAAGTGGTSGVIYAVSDTIKFDQESRVNTFAHVNHSKSDPHFGTLLCINGTGILYNWIKSNFFEHLSYADCEKIAQSVEAGAGGVLMYPFGNGAERMLSNSFPGSSVHHLDFNRHNKNHILRAGLEGIAFSFVYGLEILRELGITLNQMKVGNDNLFQSDVFSQTLADAGEVAINVVETTGATGAAIGSAYGAGLISDLPSAFSNLQTVKSITPNTSDKIIKDVYIRWKNNLLNQQN